MTEEWLVYLDELAFLLATATPQNEVAMQQFQAAQEYAYEASGTSSVG